jgi:hypothetical protein
MQWNCLDFSDQLARLMKHFGFLHSSFVVLVLKFFDFRLVEALEITDHLHLLAFRDYFQHIFLLELDKACNSGEVANVIIVVIGLEHTETPGTHFVDDSRERRMLLLRFDWWEVQLCSWKKRMKRSR